MSNALDLFSVSHKLAFYHIPKNAMTSIIHGLGMEWKYDDHLKYKVFCVLRNPLDRFTSAFHQIQSKMSDDYFNKKSYETDLDLYRKIDPTILADIFLEKNEDEKLKKYVEELMNNGAFENHQLSQSFYLNLKGKNRHDRNINNVQCFLRFDNLNEDIKNLLGIDIDLPKLNQKNQKNSGSFDNFSEDIHKLYEEDFNLYKNKIVQL